jgi:hypothetical protein
MARSIFPSLLKSAAVAEFGEPFTAGEAFVGERRKPSETGSSGADPTTMFAELMSRNDTVPVGTGFPNAATVPVRV